MDLIDHICLEITCPFCIGCHSFIKHKYLFCQSCYDRLIADRSRLIQLNQFKQFPVYSFIEWKRFESDMLSELVYHLKRFSSQKIWQDLTKEILKELEPYLSKNKQLIFIPVPGRSTSYHTHYFAKSLAEQMSGQVLLNALIHFNGEQQKQLNRKQRFNICLSWNEDFTQRVPKGAVVIIVDDIITTGATMQAASSIVHKQLVQLGNRSCTIVGLSLFYRT